MTYTQLAGNHGDYCTHEMRWNDATTLYCTGTSVGHSKTWGK